MLTIIGKNLVFAVVIFSLAGLGLSLYSAADPTDFKGEFKKVQDEISRLKTAEHYEKEELKEVLNTLSSRTRKIPRGPDEIAGNKDVTITDALKEVDDIEKKLKTIFDQQQQDVAARIALINEMQTLRAKLQQEKETGNTLRQIITPDPAQVNQGQRAFRDVIASLQVAKDEVERRTEAMQPDLYNAAIRLQSLQLRLASLQKRIAELGGGS
jgi:chromosome segregation ATPase